MFIVNTMSGNTFIADYVTRGLQFPILHIHTHDISPIQAYQYFGKPELNKEIYVKEFNYDVAQDEQFVEGITYYEINENSEYVKTSDAGMLKGKIYYKKNIEPEKVYHDFTDIYSVQKSPFLTEHDEILIWLQRPTIDYD